MDKLFFDTNVLLDVLEQRVPWFPDSTDCLALVHRGEAKGAVTALSLSDIAYLQKGTPTATLASTFRRLREFLDIATLTATTVDEALTRGLPNLEDGFQLAAALAWGATHLITRNLKDFPVDHALLIRSPVGYLRSRNDLMQGMTPPANYQQASTCG